METEYIQKVQAWVECDNRIMRHKEETSTVIERKKELEGEILTYVEGKKMDKFTINISDGSIKFSKQQVRPPLSMKSVRTALEKYNTDRGDTAVDIDEILKHITDVLEPKAKYVMKREVKPPTPNA